MRERWRSLRKSGSFGLVFEEHLPESIALPGLPIKVGSRALRRDDPEGRTVYRVDGLTVEGEACLSTEDEAEQIVVPGESLDGG